MTVRVDGKRFITPLAVALIAIGSADVIFAVDSIPAILAVTTDPFVVYTSNVFALLGMRALYFLLAGAADRIRYLRPGLAVILAAVAVKLLLADVWELPAWSAPAFIAAVLSVVAFASVRANRSQARSQRHNQRNSQVSDRHAAAASAPRDRAPAPAPEGSNRADAQHRASAAALPAARR
jgi:predicted tellurium resistance membrane protein TerC